MIDGPVLLFERLFVLLIHDHQAQRREGQKQRRARAHHHLRFTAHHRAIDPPPLFLRQIAVPLGGTNAEAHSEAFQELHRQRDFRQQDQSLLALPQRLGDRLKIDFGLARPGDAIEQMGGEFLLAHRMAQNVRRLLLVGIEFGRREFRIGGAEGGEFGKFGGLERACLDQAAHHGGGNIGVFRHPGNAARQAVIRHRQHPAPGFGQPRGNRIAFNIGDAAGFRLERATRAQRHRQNRARRIEGIGRHPIDEIAQGRGQAGKAFQRLGNLEPVVAHGTFGGAPHHTQAFAVADGRGNQQAAGRVYAARQFVVVGPVSGRGKRIPARSTAGMGVSANKRARFKMRSA